MRWKTLASLLLVILAADAVNAQFGRGRRPAGPLPGQELTQRWQVGVIVRATSGVCRGLRGTLPVPREWPDQQVRIEDEDTSPFVQSFGYRDLQQGSDLHVARQAGFFIPNLPAGEVASVLITLEITRESSQPPEDTAKFAIPTRAPREVLVYLANSPSIEARHPSIRARAKEITDGTEGAWKQVEAIFDWVRDHTKYVQGDLHGAVETLRAGQGNKEDLSNLFIALCRASGVPARTVWIPDHCYPEFYLEDAEGAGHWFPCMVAGPREFGGISDHRPILQKGESIDVPGEKDPQRFVAESLTGKGGQPQVEFIRKLLPRN